MSASATIKKILIDKKMSVKELADKLGYTPQAFSNKLFRDSFSFNEYLKIAEILGCEVKTICKDSKVEYLSIYDEELDKRREEESIKRAEKRKQIKKDTKLEAE